MPYYVGNCERLATRARVQPPERKLFGYSVRNHRWPVSAANRMVGCVNPERYKHLKISPVQFDILCKKRQVCEGSLLDPADISSIALPMRVTDALPSQYNPNGLA